jgi:small subunit ribosomal protein S17
MAEDEQKKESAEETPKDEGAEAAGPVAAGDPPPPAVAEASSEAVPPATPPADEADASEEESAATEEEPAAEETPEAAEEAPAAEPSEEDDLPWKAKRRLELSRRPHKAGPALSPEERAARRAEARKRKAGQRRSERAAAKKDRTGGIGTPVAERSPNAAKVRQGIVVSNKGEKSITVRIDIARRHPVYEKVVRRSRTLHAHDERNEAGEGDVVRLVETRPLSKTKRWRLVEVLERAK